MAFENVDYKSLDIPAAPFSNPSIIPDFPKNKVPRHVGVIMDGNGRWAQQRGLIRTDGHQAAEPVVFDTIAGAIEAGVRYLSLYTFSTENWKRSPQEVRFLMGFSRDIIHRRVDQMNEWGVRVRWSGRRPKLWKSVIDELEVAQEKTKNNKTIDVVFCLNYGGRAEIADACAAIAREVRDGKISGDRVTEKMIADHLYNPDIPDCDLVIRTSGEQRTSNFLPWEAAYAELDFVPELFPDCGRDVLWRSIDHYIHRDRRFGGVKRVKKDPAGSFSHKRPSVICQLRYPPREILHKTAVVHGERHVHAWCRWVDEPCRIADGTTACTVKIACFRLDFHRQIETFHQTRIHCDGRGKRIVQWHTR